MVSNKKTSSRPDERACRQVSLRQVVDALGLLEEDPQRAGRYRPVGYQGSYWISCDWQQNLWHSFKHDRGGSAVDLVIACLSGAPDYEIADSLAGRALAEIASAFGLWEAPPRERAERLAAAVAPREEEREYAWLERQVVALERGELADAWSEASALFAALGVESGRVTLCPYKGGLCWQPAVPWQGARVSRATIEREGRTFEGFGGWTKDRAREWWGGAGAGQIVMIDLDGNYVPAGSGIEQVAPREDLVRRLVRDLRKAGLPVAAHVWSSPGDGRSKAHLYWRSSTRAKTWGEWESWWDVCADVVRRLVREWEDVEDVERARLHVDGCTRQVQRLVRIPGVAKWGKSVAGVVEEARGVQVDFAAVMETREIAFIWGTHAYTLGERCSVVIAEPDKPAKEAQIGSDIWPLSLYRTADGAYGVRYRYHTRAGEVRYGLLSAAAGVETSAGKRAGVAAAEQGVQIAPGSGHHFAYALARWAESAQGVEVLTVVDAPGWQEECRVYLNGDRVHGASGYVASAGAGRHRALRGSLEQWQRAGAGLFDTPVMLTALAVSLAGALIEPLGRVPWGLHLVGRTTSGKTTALKAAAQIWVEDYERFNATPKSLERRALLYNGACYCLDELEQSGLRDGQLGQFVYTLLNGQERGRLTKDAELRAQGDWHSTLLTTGERSVRELLGSAALGGHLVRWIDLSVQPGDATCDALHAEECEELARLCWGVVGDAWAAHLVRLDWERVREQYAQIRRAWRARVGAEAELGRVIDHLATAGLALYLASQAGIVPWVTEQVWETWGAWMIARVTGERAGGDSPAARAWALLLADVETSLGNWPTEVMDVRAVGVVHGVVSVDEARVYLTSGMLKRFTVAAGCTVGDFADWAVAQGVLTGDAQKMRVGKVQARWYELKLGQKTGGTVDDSGDVPPNSQDWL